MRPTHSEHQHIKQRWEESFQEQVDRKAYNTAPVEALARTISYYLRDRFAAAQLHTLHFLEVGCGAGPNLLWLAQKGIRVSGVDISPTALSLTRHNLQRSGLGDRVGGLVESTVSDLPFASGVFDGVIEACVFQHLSKKHRQNAFREVGRVLKRKGIFVGYMLDTGHTVFQKGKGAQLKDDSGSLRLDNGGSRLYLTNIGLAHFFDRKEIIELLEDFSMVDPCLTTYFLPREEAEKRGYAEYLQSMWTVYAIR